MFGIETGTIAVVVEVVVGTIGITEVSIHLAKRKYRHYFRVVRKKSSRLKPVEIMDLRPYHQYYHYRPEDDTIRKGFRDRRNVLILGPPLSGKTRAAFEAIKSLAQPCLVSIPKCVNINLENFRFPKGVWFDRKYGIVFLDDFHRLVDHQNFDHLLRTALEKRVVVVATCRSGIECDKTKKKLLERGIDLESIFADHTIELKKLPEQEGRAVAQQVGKDWGTVQFDGTVGSVFLPLAEMKQRFKDCTEEQKTILRVLSTMYGFGLYEENRVFPLQWVKLFALYRGLKGAEYEWDGWLEELETKEFVTLRKGDLQVEEAYLEFVVTPIGDILDLEFLEKMIDIFAAEPDALFKLGNRVFDVGEISLEKAAYMKMAILAYKKSIEHRSAVRDSTQYAGILNNIGNAFRALAEVEEKTENCRLAIDAYQEALKIHTLDRYPADYAKLQNNLGAGYVTLAEVEEKEKNSKLAIGAYREALRVCSLDRFPRQYAAIQNNLGNSYQTLAEVEGKAENCQLAIMAFQEALQVYRLDQFPIQHAMTQNNLGTGFVTLAEVEKKAENCRQSIRAFREALQVYTVGRFPMQYAMTQNNLGAGYVTLAGAEETVENCRLAIEACREALKVYTRDRFPIQYAMTQNTIGNICRTLAGVEEKAENCRKAVDAYMEALQVYTKEQFPEAHSQILANLKNTRDFCGEL
jgi:tetratricopeptide (TPR) repeat protein